MFTSTGYRLVLDSQTCLFTNEYDPTQLRAEVAGKLTRFLVESDTDVACLSVGIGKWIRTALCCVVSQPMNESINPSVRQSEGRSV